MADNETKRTRRRIAAGLSFVLVVLNLFAFNYLSENHFARWDLTEDRKYTLSPDTKRILSQIDDLLTVKYFVTRDLPAGYLEIVERTKDLLEEFRIAAGDNLQLIFQDPSDNTTVRTEAEQYGIPEVPLQQYGSESFEMKKAYMGIAVLYEDRFEAIPVASSTDSLEYELLMHIARVMKGDLPRVAFNQGGGSMPPNLPPQLRAQYEAQNPNRDRHTLSGDYAALNERLCKQYQVDQVDLKEPVPDDVDTLVVANTENLDDAALYHLDQFIMRGGKVALLVQGVKVDLQRFHVVPASDKMDDWLAHYGITVDKNMVMDYPRCGTVGVSRQVGNMRMMTQRPFPPSLRLGAEELDKESPITKGIRDLTMTFCSSIHLDPPEGAQSKILVKSSPEAWQQEKYIILQPERIQEPGKDARKQFDLAGLLEGEFISYYAARPVPKEVFPKSEVEEAGVEGAEMPVIPGEEGGLVIPKPGAEEEKEEGGKAGGEKGGVEGGEPPPVGESGKDSLDIPGGGILPLQEEPPPGGEKKMEEEEPPPGGTEQAEGQAPPPQEKTEEAGKGGEPPPGEGGEPAGEPAGEESVMEQMEHPPGMRLRSPRTAILVVGSSDFLSSNMMSAYTWNFFSNAVDYLTVAEGFGNIRTRESSVRLIDPELKKDLGAVNIFKLTGTLGGAFFVILLGLILYFLRKAAQKREVVL